MKLIFEFLPLIVFFLTYKWGNIYLATITAIISAALHVLWGKWHSGRFEKIPLITLLFISILGGATLFFKNPLFIKWKPTVVYWILSLFFVGSLFTAETLLQKMMGKNIHLPTTIWRKLTIAWGIFFTSLGFLNIYVMYNYDTDTWVHFKLFGTLALTIIFFIVQGFYIAKFIAVPKLQKPNV